MGMEDKKMKKKVLSVLLASAMLSTVLAGCGSEPQGNSSASGDSQGSSSQQSSSSQ